MPLEVLQGSIRRSGERFAGRSVVLAALVVGAGAALSACRQGEANENADGLRSTEVSRRTIVSSVEATGSIEPIKLIDIKSQASGEILELPVELGDYVEKGRLLVKIDPRDVRNGYEQAEADLEVAEARLDVAQRQLKRTQTLRDSAVVTEEELESAILEHANAKASLVKARTNLELARDRLEDVTLRAPISGTIVERNVEEGQIITGAREVTGGTLIMRMADLTEVQVRTLVDETDIGRVSPGLPASITVEAFPDRTFRGSVLKIEPQAVVQQNVTMFAVLTRIRNEEDLLRPGMNSDVDIVLGRQDDVLSLPLAAVKTRAEAQQLAEVLGVDAEPLDRRGGLARGGDAGAARGRAGVAPGGSGGVGAARPAGSSGTTPTESAAADDGAADGDARAGSGSELPSPERLRSMSPEDRRRLFQNLSPAQRQQLFQQFRGARERQERADRANPGRPRPAFVFVSDTTSRTIRLRPITIGLSNLDYTQVIQGLEEGDQVLQIPQALVQQEELL
ncbi:MAG: efflux RND transporter periplasmic adaptor subunit, partial [Gemmatimonadota bacterium]